MCIRDSRCVVAAQSAVVRGVDLIVGRLLAVEILSLIHIYDQLPLLNLAGPVTGLLLQPIIGALSDLSLIHI